MDFAYDEAIACINHAQGLIFDFNGTLSEDEAILEHAYGTALEKLGEPLMEDEYQSLVGLSDIEIAARLLRARPRLKVAVPELLEAVTGTYVSTATASHTISPATVAWIDALQDAGTPVSIVTGTLRSMIAPVLEHAGLSSLLSTTVTIEDIAEGKPSPEGFLRGAKLLGIAPESAVVFEDSAAGVRAGTKAGMRTIAVAPPARKVGAGLAANSPAADGPAVDALASAGPAADFYIESVDALARRATSALLRAVPSAMPSAMPSAAAHGR